MRILHFIPSLHSGVGGPARAVIDLCGALALNGHEVTVMTPDAGEAAHVWLGAAIKTPQLVILPPALQPGCAYLGSVLQRIRSAVYCHDLVHVHGMWEYANIQVARIAQACNKPYVISPHGMLGEWSMQQGALKKRAFLALAGTKWLHGASAIHLTSQGEFADSARYLRSGSGHIVPLLVDLAPYRALPGPTDAETILGRAGSGTPRVLFLSRLHPVKSLETLIRASRLLHRRGRDFSLVVAGDGNPLYVAQLRSLALETAANVIFLGAVKGELKLSLYQACNVFALPTQHENFGVVFIEALACGIPVVTTRTVGLGADLRSSGAVTFVDRAPEQFADAIEPLLLDKKLAAESGRRGRDWIFDSFDPAVTIKRFEAFYADALGYSGPGLKPATMSDPLSA